MKTVTVVSVQDIATLPPVQNLVRVLLADGHRVNLICCNFSGASADIVSNENCKGYELPRVTGKTILQREIQRGQIRRQARALVQECMQRSDCLWTASMNDIVTLRETVLQYKHVMQIMELAEYVPLYRRHVHFSLKEYALHAWKNVAVEMNRAYIERVWWDLPQLPAVIPNKPFSIDYGEISSEVAEAIERMKNEKKRIVIYLGVFADDRDLVSYAKAIQSSGKYALYLAGRPLNSRGEQTIKTLVDDYQAVYLGAFNPPQHLALVQYADVGLLPYKPIKGASDFSELNALYCAPNKIWEYAGFGVPMVGSDVLGLKLPFEQWNIGRCCDMSDENAIRQAIEYVDAHHDEMGENCYKFYDSVDLHKIVADILED